MTKAIRYNETPGFQKDFKRLKKKFKSLPGDFETAKRNAIELLHIKQLDNQSIVEIPGYQHHDITVFKMRKFACKALKGKGVNSGIRITYGLSKSTNTVIFIEMYYKADQPNEDKTKINNLLESLRKKPWRKD